MLTEAQLDHVARIARLPLDAEERARLLGEAERILAQFGEVESALARAAVEGSAPGLAARGDEAGEADAAQAERIAAQFPRREGKLCKVPEGL